jgi:small acid-soluble spore protein J (minor)
MDNIDVFCPLHGWIMHNISMDNWKIKVCTEDVYYLDKSIKLSMYHNSFYEVISLGFFSKGKNKQNGNDKQALTGALRDASAALKGDPLQEAVNKKQNK